MTQITYEREDGNPSSLRMKGTGPDVMKAIAEILIGFEKAYDVDVYKLITFLPTLVNTMRGEIADIQLIDIARILVEKGGSAHE